MDDTSGSQSAQILPEISAGINNKTGELVFNNHIITKGSSMYQLLGSLMGSQPIDQTELDSIVVSNSSRQECGDHGITPVGQPVRVNSEYDENDLEQQEL